jgi:cyclase
MLKKRIIPCLDVREGRVVKGVQFQNHQVLGDILPLAEDYCRQGADELVFYDIKASTIGSEVSLYWVTQVARVVDIPFCVAGGIRDVPGARQRLEAGADKISVNSRALENPRLIADLAKAIGQQSVVVGVDSKKNPETKHWEVWQYTGSQKTMRPSGRKTLDWLAQLQDLGAGEVVLNCMDQDGMGEGYDLEQLLAAREILKIPLVASGGAGRMEHFHELFKVTSADGALAAGSFHRGELTVPTLKSYLHTKGIPVRLTFES